MGLPGWATGPPGVAGDLTAPRFLTARPRLIRMVEDCSPNTY